MLTLSEAKEWLEQGHLVYISGRIDNIIGYNYLTKINDLYFLITQYKSMPSDYKEIDQKSAYYVLEYRYPKQYYTA